MDVINRRKGWYVVLIIFVMTFTFYANGCRGPFVFDDLHNITHNTYLQLKTLDGTSLYRAIFRGPSINRPVAKLTFAFNYYFHGHHVLGYHIVNMVVHSINGCLVYWLTRLVLSRSRSTHMIERRGMNEMRVIAVAVSLIFVVHPLQTQAVTYVVQRMTSLATLFYLVTLIAYIQGRKSQNSLQIGWWCGALIGWVLALGTKENTVMIPVAIGMYEWCFRDRIDRYSVRRGSMFGVAAFLLILLMAFVYLETSNPIQDLLHRYEYRDFGMWQRLLTQFRVVVFYLTLVVFPWPERLNLVHWVATSRGFFSPLSTLLAMVTLFSLTGMVIARVRRQPVVAFGVLFILLHLVVESTIVNLEMVFEHRMYLPMVGVAICLAGLAVDLAWTRRTIVLITLPIVGVLGCWTAERNAVWSDQVRLWTDVICKNAHHARPVYNRGQAFQRLRDFDRAERDYLEAIRRESYMESFANLANMYAELERFDEAIDLLNQAVNLKPHLAVLYNNRGSVFLRQGQFDRALQDLNRAITMSPDYATAYYNRGRLFAKQGRDAQAVAEYTIAIGKDSQLIEAFVNRGNTYFREKKFQKALEDYDQAVALRSALPVVAYYRGLCRMRLRDYAGALREFGRTLQLDNKYADAYDHFAWIRATCPDSQLRDGENAVRCAQTACKLSGRKNYQYLTTLAAAYAEEGQFDDAIREQRIAIELAPASARTSLRATLSQYRQQIPYREGELSENH